MDGWILWANKYLGKILSKYHNKCEFEFDQIGINQGLLYIYATNFQNQNKQIREINHPNIESLSLKTWLLILFYLVEQYK